MRSGEMVRYRGEVYRYVRPGVIQKHGGEEMTVPHEELEVLPDQGRLQNYLVIYEGHYYEVVVNCPSEEIAARVLDDHGVVWDTLIPVRLRSQYPDMFRSCIMSVGSHTDLAWRDRIRILFHRARHGYRRR